MNINEVKKSLKNTIGDNIIDDKSLKILTEITLDHIAETLSRTFGPYGGTTIMDKFPESPKFSKDGFTVLNAIRYAGPVENAVLELVRKIATNQVISVGDGSTSAIISSNEIFKRIKDFKDTLYKNGGAKIPSYLFAKAIDGAANRYKETLLKMAKPISDDMSEIKNIATIAINNDQELGEIVYRAFKKAGKDIEVTFEKMTKQKEKAIVEFDTGIKLDYGFFIDRGYTNENNISIHLENSDVIIFNQKIEGNYMVDLFADIIQYYQITNKNCTIIFNGLGDRAREFVNNTFYRQFIENINLVYMPQNTDLTIQQAIDTALCCNCTVIDKDYVRDLKFYEAEFYEKKKMLIGNPKEISLLISQYANRINPEMLQFIGHAEDIVSFKTVTTIKGGLGLTEKKDIIEKEIQKEKERLEIMKSDNKMYTDELSMLCGKRIATLKNILVNIKVGGATAEETQATYDLIEDAVRASKSALKHGYVIGGNYAIIKAFDEIIKSFYDNMTLENILGDEDIPNKGLIRTLETHKIKSGAKYKASYEELELAIIICIAQAFVSMVQRVFSNGDFDEELSISKISYGINNDKVYNVVTESYDENIVNAANTEIEILNSAISIISILMTTNQMTVAQPQDKVSYGHALTKIASITE